MTDSQAVNTLAAGETMVPSLGELEACLKASEEDLSAAEAKQPIELASIGHRRAKDGFVVLQLPPELRRLALSRYSQPEPSELQHKTLRLFEGD